MCQICSLFILIMCLYLLLDRRLLAIERDRQPQVMRILHSDDDDDENKDSSNQDDEGAHSLSLISDREEEEETQERQNTSHRDVQSPDSLLQSPLPGSSFCFFSYHPLINSDLIWLMCLVLFFCRADQALAFIRPHLDSVSTTHSCSALYWQEDSRHSSTQT